MFSVSSLQSSPQISDEEYLSRGLNEFIDPSESPIYTLYYTTITFKEGITLDDIVEMQEYAPLMGRKDEKQAQIYTRITESEDFQAIKVGNNLEETRQSIANQATEAQQKRISLRSPEDQEKVYSISLNHETLHQGIL